MKEENIEKYIQEKKDIYSKMGFIENPFFFKKKNPYYRGKYSITLEDSLQIEFGRKYREESLNLHYLSHLGDNEVTMQIMNSKNERWNEVDKIVEDLISALNQEVSTDAIAKDELEKVGFTTVKFENNKYFGICEANDYYAIFARIDYSSKKQQIYLVENILQDLDFRYFQYMNLQPKGNISKEVLNTWVEVFK